MAMCKLQVFLLCESACVSREPDNRVSLHHLFDRIILPRTPERTDITIVWAYYKIVADAPCTVALRVTDPRQREVPGNRRHSIEQGGRVRGVWALDTGLFTEPGQYLLELQEVTHVSQPNCLASIPLVVEKEGQ